MFKLTYFHLRDGRFTGAFQKLAAFGGVTTKTAINIAKIKRVLQSETEIAETTFLVLLKNWADLDEKGEIKPHEGKPNTFSIPPEKLEEWARALKTFEESEFTVDFPQISHDEINGSRLSADEIISLEPILIDLIAALKKDTLKLEATKRDSKNLNSTP